MIVYGSKYYIKPNGHMSVYRHEDLINLATLAAVGNKILDRAYVPKLSCLFVITFVN